LIDILQLVGYVNFYCLFHKNNPHSGGTLALCLIDKNTYNLSGLVMDLLYISTQQIKPMQFEH